MGSKVKLGEGKENGKGGKNGRKGRGRTDGRVGQGRIVQYRIG